jgi:hypothetical protein
MKKKFRALLTFLRPLKEKIIFSWSAYDNNIEFEWGTCNRREVPKQFIDIVSEIVKHYQKEIENQLMDSCYSETDYYSVDFIVDPMTNSGTIKLSFEYYRYDADTYETRLNDPELEDYFKRTGTEIIEARYSGSGDSGDIDTITIDGVDSNIHYGSRDSDNKLIWDTLYGRLENAYGGWEIDDGSSGTIELNNNMEIVISHEWNMRDMDECDGSIEITMDMLED